MHFLSLQNRPLPTRAHFLKPRRGPLLPTRPLQARPVVGIEAPASRLQVARFEFARPGGIPLQLTRYDRPSRLLLARTQPRARTLFLLATGADEQGKLDDQDPLCRLLAEALTQEGCLAVATDYRKFQRGVAPNDWDGLFGNAYSDMNAAFNFLSRKGMEWQFDPDRVVAVGLSYGGLLQANLAHNRTVLALGLGSGFIPPEDLTGFLATKSLPVAIVHNQIDQSVPAGRTDWSIGGKALAEELKRRGKTVYDTYLTTPCSDGNHVPVVGRDPEATVTEYVQALVGNLLRLVG